MCKLVQETKVVNACMSSLPLKDSCINTTISSMALHWTQDITKTIAEIYRVLTKNGNLFISIPIENTFYELNYILKALKLPTIHFIKHAYVVKLLEEQGFNISSSSHITKFMQKYSSFREFISSMKKLGTNINRNTGFINKKTFYEISEIYSNRFATEKTINVSWNIAFIAAQK